MRHTPVSSSHLRSVGYDPSAKVLEVEFNDGALYRYYGVPAAVHQGLMGAESHGSYLHRHIKGQYRYEKLS